MRRAVDRAKLEKFMAEIGRRATSAGTIYLTGGATALLIGIREQTIDIDIKLDPEPGGVFEAIAELKESLGINVELASPDDFIPPLSEWRERSLWIASEGKVEFRHYDPYSQALAKIERGHDVDLADAKELVARGLVSLDRLSVMFDAIRPQFARYPAIDGEDFERKVQDFIAEANRSADS